MPTAIDLFEKARHHERLEQLQAARDHDLMPYFRVLEGPAGPVVEMEGHERIMLGSNNYLGLTGDARVKDAARDALERFGTGLTGSRFLNGAPAAPWITVVAMAAIFGDATQEVVLEAAQVSMARLVLITVPVVTVTEAVADVVRRPVFPPS